MRPLQTLHVVEFEGLGPGPLAGWMLAGLGARVTLVRRPGGNAMSQALGGPGDSLLDAGKQVVELDLKTPVGRESALALLAHADALIEGNRPGVMERLGLGPAEAGAVNARLVYARMTGWGQTGPLASAAGHDMNYVALSGLMSVGLAPGQTPWVPPTLLGDAGGAITLAFGLVSAVLSARHTGQGCVVDAAITDSVASMGMLALWLRAGGHLDAPPGESLFHDSPFYDVYRCACGGFVTVGPLEPQFYADLLHRLGLDDVAPADQHDRRQWPALKARLRALFASQTRSHWCERLEGSDACFAPVLNVAEAAGHPHLQARGVYRPDAEGRLSARPSPLFSPLPGCPGPDAAND